MYKQAWEDHSYPLSEYLPDGMFCDDAIDEDLLHDISNTKLAMRRSEAILAGDEKVDGGENGSLESGYPDFWQRNVQEALIALNVRCNEEELSLVDA